MESSLNYFYQITNLINGHFYYGVHKTNNLDDGYMGSGKRLKYAIKKYGIENFKKEILEFFDTYEDALEFESEIVNEDLVLDPNCYNLRNGGMGGFTKGEAKIGGKRAGEIYKEKLNIPEFKKEIQEKASQLFLKLHAEGRIPRNTDWTGKRHTEKSKSIIGEKNAKYQGGAGNSQYGTCWITNEKENKKIPKKDPVPEGWRLGRKMHI
jgi:hypothetical protein